MNGAAINDHSIEAPAQVERWRGERPLRGLVSLAALGLWRS